MNRDETVELFLKGREAWNAWAEGLLAEREAMEAAGTWKSHRRLEFPWWREEGQNLETEAWLNRAFADFSRCLFHVQKQKRTEGAADESKADGFPVTPTKSIQLEAYRINFSRFVFPSDVEFESATFNGEVYCFAATFTGTVRFESSTFNHHALFERTTFSLEASFESATFAGVARFEGATFAGDAQFDSVIFTSNALFRGATFGGRASFDRVTFKSDAIFVDAIFSGDARFDSANLSCGADFEGSTFNSDAWFESATFTLGAWFNNVRFTSTAFFESADFRGNTSFVESCFNRNASFYAIRGERGFDMAGTVFEDVPDFVQAHFEEAPRLDNVKVYGCWIERHQRPERKSPEILRQCRWYAARRFGRRVRTWPVRAAKGGWRRVWVGNADIPARWRALKRLAIQGHDTERELEFHSRELQSQRFEDDWPLPLRFWSADAWVGALRFWSGLFYGLFSDFGRSIFRPFLLWWATIAVFALYFLAGQPDVLERRHTAGPQGASTVAYVKLIPSLLRDPPPCYAGPPGEDARPSPGRLTGLVAPVAASTNALAEAFRLAIRNGSIFLDGGDDSARRTYGCLYGIQSYGGSPAPFVPGFVSDASGLQKVLSALYIFLFGLALRNILKMK